MEPDCAEIVVEFSVPKVIGRVGGSSTSNGLRVVVVVVVVDDVDVVVVTVLVVVVVVVVIVVPKAFPFPAPTTISAVTVLVWYSVGTSTLSKIDRMRLVTR